jgi:hypothetical protein
VLKDQGFPAQGSADAAGEFVVRRGQAGSASATSTPVAGVAPATHGSAPAGGGESSNDTISALVGIAAFYCSFVMCFLLRSGRRFS